MRARTDTPLTRAIESAEGRATPRRALELAREKFLRGERIELKELADELGVSRATLFRWVGTRDQLLGEVVWSIGGHAFESIVQRTKGQGAKRIATILGTMARESIRAKHAQAFLQREPELALRIMTMGTGVVQRRMVETVQALVKEEVDRGTIEPRLPVADLAYVIVRIAESFSYTDVITGSKPDPKKLERTIEALLD